MKAEELMIGDFLRFKQDYPFKQLQGKIVMVRGIRGRVDVRTIDDGNYYESEHPDWLEPIPLTHEILERNGFRYTNEHTLKGADTYKLRLEQRGYDLTITIKLNDYFALDSLDDRVYRLVEISTGKWYVHHLQDALRLFGIEKEIVL